MGGGKDNAAVAGLKHTFCGAMAGAITKTSVAPLERVKIIMQVHGMKDGLEQDLGKGNRQASLWRISL